MKSSQEELSILNKLKMCLEKHMNTNILIRVMVYILKSTSGVILKILAMI